MKLGRAIISLLLIPILTVCFHNTGVAANPPAVLINEIAWMGTAESANNEWMELKNTTDAEVDLSGWIFKAGDGQPKINLNGKIAGGGYFLLERTSDNPVPGIPADQPNYSGALGNDGEILELFDGSGNLVDRVDFSAKWKLNGAGDVVGDNATKRTAERRVDGAWQTSLDPGGTPRAENSAGEPPASEPADENEENPDQGEDKTGEEIKPPADTSSDAEINDSQNSARLGEVLINELVSDPADDEVEWVEIFNTTSREWDLSGWTLEDGSGAKTALTGKISASGTEKYYVIEKPKGNLNNKGDLIILRDVKANLIDQLAYGDWDDGSPENNAPVASDPNSLARIMDGYNTFNNKNDFQATKKITPGFGNIIEAEDDPESVKQSGVCVDIIFTEILPDPAGEDGEDEFIELYNFGKAEIDLTSWKIKDESGKQFVFKKETAGAGDGKQAGMILKSGEYSAVYRSESKLALNNTKDFLELFEPEKEKACKSLNYEKATEGFSYSYDFSEKRWVWSEVATPDAENKIKKMNAAPEADFNNPEKILAGIPIRFDSSDTADENGDALKFFWDFGDGIVNRLANPEHTFLKAGNFAVKLAVSDGQATSTKEKVIKALAPGDDSADGKNSGIDGDNEDSDITLAKDQPNLTGLRINEIFPDPSGSDLDGEFIELWNSGGVRMNAINWILRDASASGKYRIKDDLWLEPDALFMVKREISGLTLNNDTDKVRLFNSLDELSEEVEYSGAMEGASYAKGENGKWFWTTKVTPGEKNIIAAAEIALKNGSAKSGTVKGVKNATAADDSEFQALELDKVYEIEKGEKISTRGIVAVLPGVFGSQYFYIISGASLSPSTNPAPEQDKEDAVIAGAGGEGDAPENCGIQVYNYKKEFPDLKVGDIVEVRGEITEISGEKRIKTSMPEDMKIIQPGNPPEPARVTGNGIEDAVSGGLVKIAGLITERKGYQFYIDDGEAEAVGYIKKSTGIKTAEVVEGDEIELTGILIRNDSGARIFPRGPEDLVKAKKTAALDGSGNGSGAEVQIAGELPPADEWAIAGRDRKLQMFKYFLIIAGAAIIGLLIWLGKLLREKD